MPFISAFIVNADFFLLFWVWLAIAARLQFKLLRRSMKEAARGLSV